MSGKRPHGFGIVGAGVIAQVHAEALAGLANARLVAVSDVVTERARAFAEAQGCAAEANLDALLSRGDLDVVCVCVPSGLHAEIAVRAAEAGRHLVVEKPIDVTLEAADRLIAAVRRAGVTATVISQHRFDDGLVELRRLLDAGALGRLLFGEARTKWYRSQAYYDSDAWRGTYALDGGGALINQGIHYADLLCWTMGPVAEVTALAATQIHEIEVEDLAVALVRFASGALGTLVATTAAFPGYAERLEVSGTGGSVIVEDGRVIACGLLAEQAGVGERGERVATAVGAPPGSGLVGDLVANRSASHARQIADLLAAVDSGREPQVRLEDGRDALQLVLAVYRSAAEGRPVRLPLPSVQGSTMLSP